MRCLLALLIATTAGCGSTRYMAVRKVEDQPTTAVSGRTAPGEPVKIALQDRDRVWDEIVDVVSQHYDIQEETRGAAIGDNLLARSQPGSQPAAVGDEEVPERLKRASRSDAQGELAGGWTGADANTESPVMFPESETADTAATLFSPEAGESSPSMRRRSYLHMTPADKGFLLDVSVFKDVWNPQYPEPFSLAAANDDTADEANADLPPRWIDDGHDARMEEALVAEIRERLDGEGLAPACDEEDDECGWYEQLKRDLWSGKEKWLTDQRNFYSKPYLIKAGLGIVVAAIMANTTIDGKFDGFYQNNMVSSGSDAFVNNIHPLGDGTKTLPYIIAATAITTLTKDAPYFSYVPFWAETNEWGWRTLRGYAVGTIPLLTLQYAFGTDRPGAQPTGSHWTPLKHDHGVSGDAFMGGMLFITAAKMTDNKLLKAAFYAGSTITGIGRLNDHQHYLSQVCFGWFLAYLSCSAVDDTQEEWKQYKVVPVNMNIAGGYGSGLGVEFKF